MNPKPSLLLLALLIVLPLARTAQADEPCDPIARSEIAPTYVVLYGYPHLPGAPDRTLTQVGHDLRLMAAFFDALAPRRVWIHGEPEPELTAAFGDTLRAPTWRALRETVAELRAELRDQPDARVYLYFAGHGRPRGDGDTLGGVLYGRPEPDATEPGHDGEIDGGLIAHQLLRPLADAAEVHLIVDACGSFYLLTARNGPGRTRAPKTPPRDLTRAFATELPHVGALLASAETTYETHAIGGIFSHALRTAALGVADLDRDAVITYGELHYTLMKLLSDPSHAARPTIVPPGLDRDAPFIDWRRTPAARVCLIDAKDPVTRLVVAPRGIMATLPIPPRDTPLWLHRDETYTLHGAEGTLRFVARDGVIRAAEPPTPGSAPHWPIFDKPIDLDAAQPPPLPPVPPWEPPWYLGFGVTGAATSFLRDNQWAFAALASARLGRAFDRLAVEGGWSGYTVDRTIDTSLGTRTQRLETDVMFARIGYDRLLTHEGYELGVAALIGAVQTLGESFDPTAEGTLRATALLPLPFLPELSLRLDARLSALPAASGFEPTFQVGAGIDYEYSFE